ncbi:MAG TPA: sensor histidine kinase [Bryobacteraceae bacterium]|nr:sensor histidine kinase [Bryobacteraceae bacterium]
MSRNGQTPAENLAHAASSLTGRIVEEFHRLAEFVFPHAQRLEQQFLRSLRRMRLDEKAVSAISKLTAGAAATLLAGGWRIDDFFEQVEYNGRRLAKLKVPPKRAAEALEKYDAMVSNLLAPQEDVAWVLGQLRASVLLTLNTAYFQVREAEGEAFFALFQAELLSRNPDDLLARFLEALRSYCRSDAARAYLLVRDGNASRWELRGEADAGRSRAALRERQASAGLIRKLKAPCCFGPAEAPANLIDPGWRKVYRTCWSVPVYCGGHFEGALQFGFRKDYVWLPREQDLLAAAADRAALAIEKARLVEDLAVSDRKVRQLARRMIRAEALERKRISRELHDETGQSLLCIRLQLEMLENGLRGRSLAARDISSIRSRVRETRHLAELSIVEMRRLIAALSPSALEELGLSAAIRQLVKRFRGIFHGEVAVSLAALDNLPGDIQVVAFRIVQESLNNIAKHSQARRVMLFVGTADGNLRIEVCDDGIGFNSRRALSSTSFGLRGLHERISLLGGDFEIESRRQARGESGTQAGTKMIISIPLVLDVGAPQNGGLLESRQPRVPSGTPPLCPARSM